MDVKTTQTSGYRKPALEKRYPSKQKKVTPIS